jgi:hypothetical protein
MLLKPGPNDGMHVIAGRIGPLAWLFRKAVRLEHRSRRHRHPPVRLGHADRIEESSREAGVRNELAVNQARLHRTSENERSCPARARRVPLLANVTFAGLTLRSHARAFANEYGDLTP